MSAKIKSTEIVEALSAAIEERKKANADDSYVASLFAKGREHILKKVGEEAFETVLAAQTGNKNNLVYETADLWFHTLVMLAEQDLQADDVLQELARRFGLSGHEEKRLRADK